jgi:hypothetical protein
MEDWRIGERVITYIIKANLISAPEPNLLIWSANAYEHVGAAVKDLIQLQRAIDHPS